MYFFTNICTVLKCWIQASSLEVYLKYCTEVQEINYLLDNGNTGMFQIMSLSSLD